MPGMHKRKPLLTRHRRQRYILWALAMLQWIAAVISGTTIGARQMHQRGDISLAGLTRMVLQLAVIRAAELARPRSRTATFFKRGRDLRRRHLLRSVIGSRLRRSLKHRTLGVRVARLIAVLRDLDSFAHALAKRFRRRLTRLWPVMAIPARADVIHGPPAPSPALADSS